MSVQDKVSFNPDVREIIRATQVCVTDNSQIIHSFNPDVREIIRATW